MDFDPRITSDGAGYRSGHGWYCNFHCGYGQDEDVENEKSCIQVLQLLIAKADAEVNDLEDELAILQCQLKWKESDVQGDPYELFCDVLKSKIDSLTSATESLRNENGLCARHMDATMDLQRPTQRISYIIYALIRPEIPEFDEEDQRLSNVRRHHGSSIKPREGSEQTALIEVSTGEENSKLGVLQHGESMKCMARSKIGKATSSPVPAEKEVTMKVEEDDYDINVQLYAYNLLTKNPNHEKEHKVKDHQKAFEDHTEITERKTILQSGMNEVLKQQGQNACQKRLHCGGVKGKVLLDAEAPQELSSTSKVRSRLHFAGERDSKFEEDLMIYANPFQAKGQLWPKNDNASKPYKSNATKQEMSWDWKSSKYDFEALRQKVSEDPNYLARLRIPELKVILKQNKIMGCGKLKKEMIIKELIKQLGLTEMTG